MGYSISDFLNLVLQLALISQIVNNLSKAFKFNTSRTTLFVNNPNQIVDYVKNNRILRFFYTVLTP